jgi:hypothetical protein
MTIWHVVSSRYKGLGICLKSRQVCAWWLVEVLQWTQGSRTVSTELVVLVVTVELTPAGCQWCTWVLAPGCFLWHRIRVGDVCVHGGVNGMECAGAAWVGVTGWAVHSYCKAWWCWNWWVGWWPWLATHTHPSFLAACASRYL